MSWQSFDALAGSWLVHALQASWQVALLIGGVWLVQRLAGKRLSPRWRHALWWLVALRLALPSLPTLPYAPVDWNAAEQAVDTRVAEWTPAALPFAPPTPLAETAMAADELEPLGTPTSNARVTWYLPAEPVTPEPEPASPWMQRALFGLWFLGVLWSAGMLLACERRFRRRLGQAQPVREPRLLEELRQEARRCGLPAAPPAFHLGGLPSPAVMGLRRGRLLLPVDFGRGLGAEARRSILRHELFHLRHRDPWQELGLRLLGTLFWFHPLVHFAFAQLRRERESLRDWEALNVDRGLAPTQYAHTLLDLVARPADDDRDARPPDSLPPNSIPLATGFLENAQDLPRRMQMITSFRPSNLRDLGLGGLALAGTAWLALASASTDVSPDVTPSADQGVQARTQLRVARLDAVPAWKQELYHELDTPLESEVVLEALPGSELGARLQAALGIPVLVQPNDPDLELLEFDYRSRPGISKREMLIELSSRGGGDLNWSLNFGGLLIGSSGAAPQDIGRYALDVTPLDEAGFDNDTLIEFIVEFGDDPETWDYDRTAIYEMGYGQLMLTHTREVVERAKEFCEDLLAGDSPRFDAAQEARARHIENLQRSLGADVEGYTVPDEVARIVAQRSGVPVRVAGDVAELSQDLSGELSCAHALSWLAYADDGLFEVDEHGAWLGASELDSRPLWTNVHPISDLLSHLDEEFLYEQIYSTVIGNTDHDPYLVFEQELLILRAEPSSHARVSHFLAQLEQHLGL